MYLISQTFSVLMFFCTYAQTVGTKITFSMAEISPHLSGNWTEDYEYIYDYYNDSDTCCVGGVCTQYRSMQFGAVFVPVLYTVVLVLGLLGNGLVLAVLGQLRRGWSVTDTFVVHLAVADTLLLLTLPFWAAQAASEWHFGTPLCKITGALYQVGGRYTPTSTALP